MSTLDAATDLLTLFADPTRVRLVALLSAQELTVAELTAVTELAQSRVSTHLGKLREAGVLRDRRVGPSTFYRVNDGAMPARAKQLWGLLEGALRDPLLDGDRARCAALVAARERSAPWPDALAGQMERHYSPGRTWESMARGFLGLMHLGDVLDAGAGDGSVAQLLAPRARSVTCVDRSARMVEAARARLAECAHARVLEAELTQLPFEPGAFDQVLLFNVLTHISEPTRALSECARVLRKHGTLVLVTLAPHAHRDVAEAYGHAHHGIAPDEIHRMLSAAKLTVEHCAISSRERRAPHFEVLTAFATKH